MPDPVDLRGVRRGASVSGSGFSPRVERYLSAIPGGLDGFPECQAKGALVRNLLERQPLEDVIPRLAPPLRCIVEEPPVGSEWIPEVHFSALLLAVGDARGFTDVEVLSWTRERNRALFRSAAYRILMAVASPAQLIRFAGARWGNWHRGSTLDIEGIADDGVRCVLRHPPFLFDSMLHRVYAEAFVAALELAHAPNPSVQVATESTELVRYRAAWR
jgi:hypothetical protein